MILDHFKGAAADLLTRLLEAISRMSMSLDTVIVGSAPKTTDVGLAPQTTFGMPACVHGCASLTLL